MSYNLSKLSRSRMVGLHPDLIKIVELAIKLTKVDFRVQEGLRTIETQREYVKKGASQTMNSRHLTGKAVDVVALPAGVVSWDLKHYCTIAQAFKEASESLAIPVRWGGCWLELSSVTDPMKSVEAYSANKRANKQKAFIDSPHFELPTRVYG